MPGLISQAHFHKHNHCETWVFLLTKEVSPSYPFQLGHLLGKLVADLAMDFSSTECFQMEKRKIPAKESLCFVVLYQA